MDLALLILRLVLGLVFAAHGAQKLFGAFGGRGITGTAAMFEQLGLHPGRANAWASGTTEMLGGLLLAVGLFTPFAAVGLIAVQTAAILTVHLKQGFFTAKGGYEFNLVLVAAVVVLAGVGAGAWSLDNAFGFDLAGTGWALVALGAGVLGGLGAVFTGRVAGESSARRGHAQAA